MHAAPGSPGPTTARRRARVVLTAVLAAAVGLTGSAAAQPAPPPVAAQQQVPTVTIGVTQAAGTYTFTGTVDPAIAGVQVTIARLGTDGRITGVASTRTGADGRYELRTALPLGLASYYALTAPTADLPAGRSRLYGLLVNVLPGSVTTPTVSLDVRRGSSTYVFSGQVTPGRSVPITLARLVDGRPVGVVGTRTPPGGQYAISQAVGPGTHFFQVLTGAANGLTAARSRVYGLVVPPAGGARPPAITPVHGGTSFGVYLVVADDPADPRLRASAESARRVGYTAATTTLGCDVGAAQGLGRAPSSQAYATVVHFRTEAAARQFAALHPPVEAGVVRVRTFCLD